MSMWSHSFLKFYAATRNLQIQRYFGHFYGLINRGLRNPIAAEGWGRAPIYVDCQNTSFTAVTILVGITREAYPRFLEARWTRNQVIALAAGDYDGQRLAGLPVTMGRATRIKPGDTDCWSWKTLVSIGTEKRGGWNRRELTWKLEHRTGAPDWSWLHFATTCRDPLSSARTDDPSTHPFPVPSMRQNRGRREQPRVRLHSQLYEQLRQRIASWRLGMSSL